MGYVFGFLPFRYPETLKQTFFGRETHQFAGWKLAGFVSGRVPFDTFFSLKDHLSGWFSGKLSHGYNEVFPMVVGSFRQKSTKKTPFDLHPGRLTWNLQITHLERKMIFQASMIMFHVNLPGCITGGEPITTEPSTGNRPVASSGRQVTATVASGAKRASLKLGEMVTPSGQLGVSDARSWWGWLGRGPKGCQNEW